MDGYNSTPEVKVFQKGSVVIREGDFSCNEMYILLRGTAMMFRNYQKPNQTFFGELYAGGFFGEMALFTEKAENMTVVAKEEIVALEINKQNVLNFIKTQPETVFSILKVVCERLEELPLKEQTFVEEKEEAILSNLKGEMPANKEKVLQHVETELFPKGHRQYELPQENQNMEFILEREVSCPLCGTLFKTPSIRMSKLILKKKDSDMRAHYKGFEPLYYDIVTCTKCHYSALGELFDKAMRSRENIVRPLLDEYGKTLHMELSAPRDAYTVFAGYYLALLCAPCFANKELLEAKLWLRISWLYDDCKDSKLAEYALKKSWEIYLFAYETLSIPERQNQSLCYMIGELSLRLGDFKTARDFLFKAKTDKMGTAVLKQQSDIRLEEIRKTMEETKS